MDDREVQLRITYLEAAVTCLYREKVCDAVQVCQTVLTVRWLHLGLSLDCHHLKHSSLVPRTHCCIVTQDLRLILDQDNSLRSPGAGVVTASKHLGNLHLQ